MLSFYIFYFSIFLLSMAMKNALDAYLKLPLIDLEKINLYKFNILSFIFFFVASFLIK